MYGSICEEPHKIPYYAALLAIVSSGTLQEENPTSGAANLSRPVLEDLFKAFQASLDALAWRDIRFFVSLFDSLAKFEANTLMFVDYLLRSSCQLGNDQP